MSAITSRQRRANDRRRYWAGYAATKARYPRPGWGFTAAEHDSYVREIFRLEKDDQREARRAARRQR